MLELILSLFICALGFLPAIIITVIAFVINPVLGVLTALFFLTVFAVALVYGIYRIKHGKK